MRRPWTLAVAAVALSASAFLAGPAGAATGASGWSIQPSPNPAGSGVTTLGAVSCPGDGTCMAVGAYILAQTDFTLAEHWDGSAWTIETTPNPAKSTASLLLGVSCAGPASCTAVGFSIQPQSVIRALVEQWGGTAWTIVPVRLPPDSSYAALYSVSCPAANSCTAVGDYIRNGVNSQSQPLAEHWDGTTWTIEPTPSLHAENGSGLAGVSCTGAVVCTAVGNYAHADVDQSVFAFRWNGIR